MFGSLGDYNKAQEHLQKALVIKRKIGDKQGEAIVYGTLGTLFQSLGDYVKAIEKAEECHEKSLALSEQIRCVDLQFSNRLHLTYDTLLLEGNVNKVVSNLLKSIQKCEEMRGFLRDHDHLKISFFDEHFSPYQMLSALFCINGKPREALYVPELGRARALADIMSAQYSVDKNILVNPQSWVGIERIMENECNSACLYISYYKSYLFLWILEHEELRP